MHYFNSHYFEISYFLREDLDAKKGDQILEAKDDAFKHDEVKDIFYHNIANDNPEVNDEKLSRKETGRFQINANSHYFPNSH